jgi:hypothetical protein
VSFLIGFPFVRLGGAGRDDANDFLIVLFIKSMDDQKNRTETYGPNSEPAFLFVKGGVKVR